MRFDYVVFLICFVCQIDNFINDDDLTITTSSEASDSDSDSDSSFEFVHKKTPPRTRSVSAMDMNIKVRDYLRAIVDESDTREIFVSDFNKSHQDRKHRREFVKKVDTVLYLNVQDMKKNHSMMRMYDVITSFHKRFKTIDNDIDTETPDWQTTDRDIIVHMVDQFIWEYDPAYIHQFDCELQAKKPAAKKPCLLYTSDAADE